MPNMHVMYKNIIYIIKNILISRTFFVMRYSAAVNRYFSYARMAYIVYRLPHLAEEEKNPNAFTKQVDRLELLIISYYIRIRYFVTI